MPHLLSISIGPVQGFIASARRFRDLWFGSYFLVELAKAAAEAIAEAEGLDSLIFPAPDRLEQLTSTDFKISNKLLAKIDGDPTKIAEHAKATAVRRLKEIAKEAFDRAEEIAAFDRRTAEKQLDDLLEWQWAAVPYDGKNYSEARRRVEELLAARKNTKNFAPVSWLEDENTGKRPKSSLDGQREAVLDAAMPKNKMIRLGLKTGENLCGIGLLKRLGAPEQSEKIPSTSEMAGRTAIRIAGEKGKTAKEEYQQKLESLELWRGKHFDLQWIFENRLDELVEKDKLPEAKAALDDFRKKSGISDPFPYYAILQADGDRMGKTLDNIREPKRHQEFSRALAAFADRAEDIVASHEGQLIYAGGDDVVAIMPVYSALKCARELSDAFKNALRAFGDSATLSVGIAIGHHLDPAGDTRENAQQAERLAKQDRNALGLLLSKRSGSDLEIKGKWGEIDLRLNRWIAMHQDGSLSKGIAYELRTLATTLKTPIEDEVLAKACVAEAKRILKRKNESGGAKPIEKDTLNLIFADLDKENVTVDALASELIAARFLAGAR